MKLSKISESAAAAANSRLRFLLLAAGGVLTGLTLVFPVLGLLEWITLIPVGAVLLCRVRESEARLRSLYIDGLVFFYSFYLVCYHWFINLYPLEFVEGMTKGGALVVVAVAWFGLSLLQALMGGLVFVLAGVIAKGRLFERVPLLLAFAAAGLWSVFEWTQTLGWWGVPWGRLPIGQSKYLLGLQNASWFGSYFVTFVLVAVNFCLAYALLSLPKVKAARIGAAAALCLLVFQYASGALIYFTNDVSEGTRLRVACIQGNISSSDKWDENNTQRMLENYFSYSRQAVEQGAELIVWPETAFPSDISRNDSTYAQLIGDFTKRHGVYLLAGAYISDDSGNLLNSLICFTPEGKPMEQVYSKRHLVPFGEYVPMQSIIETVLPPLAELVLSNNDLTAGEGAKIMDIPTDSGESVSIGGLICFDSIYETLTLESVREGAELICLGTNDSWFTDSAALYMHNAQAQLRAIESGRYVARAANTGISTVIDSRGRVIDSLEPLVGGIIVEDVYCTDKNTLWSYVGNLFVFLLALIYLCLTTQVSVTEIKEKINKKNKIT